VKKISEEEIFNFLKDIEIGKITLKSDYSPQRVEHSNVVYKASNGWEIAVYNDANWWDYIDYIKTNEGKEIDFDSLQEMKQIESYEPSDEICWNAYKIPNGFTFRCIKCGKSLQNSEPWMLNSTEDICPKCRDQNTL